MTTYVFFIGGTGVRVLRSLCMLLASGVKVPAKSKIVPIIIDYDAYNADMKRTEKIVNCYKKINNTLYRKASEELTEGFFRPDLLTLSTMKDERSDKALSDSFVVQLDSDNKTFAQFIREAELSPETRSLLRLLYNSSPNGNPATELNLNLEVGFKGNPNIGSVVVNKLFGSPEFNHFRNVFAEKDRIFIVGSIFGGTGSSGLPSIVKKLRNVTDPKNSALVINAPIGLSVILPYFKVEQDAKSAIDSGTFNSKAKAALTYYQNEINNLCQEIYYIADNPNKAFPNNEGGEAQKNQAHVVELLSAMSIVEFINRKDEVLKPDERLCRTQYYEFGLKETEGKPEPLHDPIRIDDFFDGTQLKYTKMLTAFAYYNKLHRTLLKESVKESFYKQLNLDEEMKNNTFFKEHLVEFQTCFEEWISELEGENAMFPRESHPRPFKPFNMEVDAGFNRLLTHRDVEGLDKKPLWKGGGSFFITQLNQKLDKIKKESSQANEELFMRIVYSVCLDAATK